MQRDWVCAQIMVTLTEKVNVEVPSVDTDLLETGILDSMTLVELIMHIEETFGITITLKDIEFDRLRSVARIAELVDHLLALRMKLNVGVPR